MPDQKQMKPNSKWINDWHTGIESARETAISAGILQYFMDFWDQMKLEEKSKTTKRRYYSSLHALGGHLVEKATSDDDLEDTVDELLSKYGVLSEKTYLRVKGFFIPYFMHQVAVFLL